MLAALRVLSLRNYHHPMAALANLTITRDFRTSPTIGYITTGDASASDTAQDSTTTTLPNPFATPEQITERIHNGT
jgi:hypothetical protein